MNGVALSDGRLLSELTIKGGYKWAMVHLGIMVDEWEKKHGFDKDNRAALSYLSLFYQLFEAQKFNTTK